MPHSRSLYPLQIPYLLPLLPYTYLQPTTKDIKIDFSNVTEIFGYVPQIKLSNFSFPVLACNVDDIDQELIGWNDHRHSYDHHNLIFDVPWPGMKRKEIITGNTRDAANIADNPVYEDVTSFSTTHKSNEVSIESKGGETPIFSVVKHWPPEWKQQLITHTRIEAM